MCICICLYIYLYISSVAAVVSCAAFLIKITYNPINIPMTSVPAFKNQLKVNALYRSQLQLQLRLQLLALVVVYLFFLVCFLLMMSLFMCVVALFVVVFGRAPAICCYIYQKSKTHQTPTKQPAASTK